uniref:RING-type E3 ubiquitin transferase n=1 Tax=Rhipicephalus zambeziensis TaxID=60191 RepID=A0A224YVQ3_9ACAR
MTVERRQELEAIAQRHERERQARHSSATRRNQNRYLPRGATTSDERLRLYLLNLWAVPSTSHYREASPEFYRENPACTHRLVPWINRELNAVLRQNRSRVVAAMDHVMGLILNFDIRHPQFARNMEPFLHEYTEHFVHEFYLFATSVYDMADYDIRTVYSSPDAACVRARNPVERFRRALWESEQAAAAAAHAAQIAERPSSPQPGPSGLAVAREEVVTTSVDSDGDSDSSDCVVVRVVKPARERTPVVIDLLSSDEEEPASHDNRQAGPSNQDAGPSSSSGPSEDRKPHKQCADADLSSSDTADEQPQRRHALRRATSDSSSSEVHDKHPRRQHSHAREHSKTERDRGKYSDRHGSSTRSGRRQQRDAQRGADRSRRSSTSSDEYGHPPPPRPRKLVSVVGAVSIASKPHEVSHHERRHSHHRHHERRSKKKSTRKHKHKKRSSSPDF